MRIKEMERKIRRNENKLMAVLCMAPVMLPLNPIVIDNSVER